MRTLHLIAGIATAGLALAACADEQPTRTGETTTQATSSSEGTPATQGVTPSATTFPAGTVALFDVTAGTGRPVDLGVAALRVSWVADGDSVVALDGYTGKFLVLELDGTVVREVADLRFTTGYEPRGVIDVQPARDQRHIVVTDMEALTMSLVDAADGTTETILENAFGGGEFSPDGEWMAGSRAPIGPDGNVDTAAVVAGVFARSGSCGDPAPYACLEWELSQAAGQQRYFASRTWAPDGRHLLLRVTTPCIETPGAAQAPCNPEATFEVYAWPSRDLVTSIDAGYGNVDWAGAGRLLLAGVPSESGVTGNTRLQKLDGTTSVIPEALRGCCVSFSPDGTHAVGSVIPGEDCSLFEVETGRVLVSVPAGEGDTNDTGICQFVSWTRDGSLAIASGVSPP